MANEFEATVYLPPKGGKWNDTTSLGDDKDISEYSKPYGNMDIMNEKEIEDAVYPPVNDTGEYHHKDGKFRHPETLYLVPGQPKTRNDSQAR